MKKENLLKTYPSYGTSGTDYCNSRQSLPDQTFCILIYMVNKIVIFIREKSENFDSNVCGNHEYFPQFITSTCGTCRLLMISTMSFCGTDSKFLLIMMLLQFASRTMKRRQKSWRYRKQTKDCYSVRGDNRGFCTAAMLHDKNNENILHKKESIAPTMQHGCRAKPQTNNPSK